MSEVVDVLRQTILQKREELDRLHRAWAELTGEPFEAKSQGRGSGILEDLVKVLTETDHPMTVKEMFEALRRRGVETTAGTVKQVANRAARRKRILRPEPGKFTVDRQATTA